MKTQVFKNSETEKTSHFMMLVSMIVFCEILLFIVNNEQSFSGNGFSVTQTKDDGVSLEFNGRLTENKVSRENESIKNPGLNSAVTMAKMREYLIPENEPELTVDYANSMLFPDVVNVELAATEFASNDDSFMLDLKKQASEKTKEAVELYAFEKKIREYLTVETEKPLELEDWMTNEKCWCPK
ncbi:MAG TPA: hypothetical protein VLQ91_18140 [Draconibacterium sp.]|nr:hypothetical protein [Draconibacterium sp.]